MIFCESQILLRQLHDTCFVLLYTELIVGDETAAIDLTRKCSAKPSYFSFSWATPSR